MEKKNKHIEAAAKAIYSNGLFAANFSPMPPEIFKPTKEVKYRDTEERYSEFECKLLAEKYAWFKRLSKFKVNKVKVDITQVPGFEITLDENPVGFVEEWNDKFRLRFCLAVDNEEGYEWKTYPRLFDDINDVKKLLSIYYGRIQDRYKFYIEPKEVEVVEEKEIDEDEIFDNQY